MTGAGVVERDVSASPAGERGSGKLLLALAAFLLLPGVPQLKVLLPVEQSLLLLVPALAACALVGWWAGGKLLFAAAWVGLAILVSASPARAGNESAAFHTLVRGWSLILAGSFGMVSLFGAHRPFFSRALLAVGLALGLGFVLTVSGPVSLSAIEGRVAAELAQRNAETMGTLNRFVEQYPTEWKELVARWPQAAELLPQTEAQLRLLAGAGLTLFPALLALQSLAALALVWSGYHRLARARLGAPLAQLRLFRFNDQLVWGLIVGITIMVLPTLGVYRDLGRNLILFFGALYALRGLGVVSWFMNPRGFTIMLAVGIGMLFWPVLNVIALFGFLLLAFAAFGLGLGDTWADWRNRARPTS